MAKRGRPRGIPKTGGRKPGSLNKNTKNFRDILAEFEDGKGFEPVKELMNLYTLIHADNPLVAVKILISLMDRLHPSLKAIEHSGEISNPYMEKSLEELEALVREELNK